MTTVTSLDSATATAQLADLRSRGIGERIGDAVPTLVGQLLEQPDNQSDH
jgi:hypothetical protein